MMERNFGRVEGRNCSRFVRALKVIADKWGVDGGSNTGWECESAEGGH